MARRMMEAYRALGCEPSWTCAPYQAGHRPALGSDVAWGESNAVVFCNSVLGARTNRYGDFLDIACAIAGRAPDYGLHRPENRRATARLRRLARLPPAFLASEIAWPVLGSLYGREVGNAIGVVTGVAAHPGEDALKAFGAAAASSGAVGLFHIAGVTPEAPDARRRRSAATPPRRSSASRAAMVREAQARLSTADRPIASTRWRSAARICRSPSSTRWSACSPAARLARADLCLHRPPCAGARSTATAAARRWKRSGVVIVADTCVVVTPILPDLPGGVLMTNSGKFAHYAPGNTGYARASTARWPTASRAPSPAGRCFAELAA